MIAPHLNLGFARLAALLHRCRILPTDTAKASVEWAKAATVRGWTLIPDRWWKCVVMVALAASAAAGAYRAVRWWFYVPPCTDQNMLAVVASMRDHPGQWARDGSPEHGYSNNRLQHSSGLGVTLRPDYGSDWITVGDVDNDHISTGCKAAIRQVGVPIMDNLLQREADAAGAAARQAVAR